MMEFPYDKKIKTDIPPLQQISFGDTCFTYMKWPSYLKGPDRESTIVKARILIVHGFCEYTTIYHRLMDQLALEGIESFVFDQRGSGDTSPGKLRGITNEEKTFSDLDHFIQVNLEECRSNNTKLFLFGHSMGGGIVLKYACDGLHKDFISGIICSAPLIDLNPSSQPAWVVRKISPLLAKFLPNFRINTNLDIEGLSNDTEYKDFIRNDPKSTMIGSFRQIYDFLERGKRLLTDKSLVTKFNKPVLLMHGMDDTINDYKASAHFMEQILPSNHDKSLKLYKNARHSILSLESDQYFNIAFRDLLTWLQEHIDSREPTHCC